MIDLREGKCLESFLGKITLKVSCSKFNAGGERVFFSLKILT